MAKQKAVTPEAPPAVPPAAARMVTIGSCVPRQLLTLSDKMAWLKTTLKEKRCDLLLLPQEWLGGHYVQKLARERQQASPLHVERDWLDDHCGELAHQYRTALGVGACVRSDDDKTLGTEDYVFYDTDGKMRGWHRKFALPRYDDYRAQGAGRLRPETSWGVRTQPVDLPSLDLRMGTVFCWEVFATTLVPAYSLARANLLVHPIKFAPRGWLKTSVIAGEQHITGFGHAPKSDEWIDRLKMLSRFEAICPIAISCNTWHLGSKFKALTGHVDEVLKTTELIECGSEPSDEVLHTFQVKPSLYSAGTENTFSLGAFKEATGSIDGYGELGPLTMALKMKRLEAYLIGDTTKWDVQLKDLQGLRKKPSTFRRAQAAGLLGTKPASFFDNAEEEA